MGLGNVTKAIWTLLQGTTNPDVVAIYNSLYQKIGGTKMGAGRVFYVDWINGDNGYIGTTPQLPFETITYALTQCQNDRDDYIIVLDCYNTEPAYPVVINVSRIHIIGLAMATMNPYPYPIMTGGGAASVFRIAANYVEIAGFGLGSAGGAGIDLTASFGGAWIHHNVFGETLVTQDGITSAVADCPSFSTIEKNMFDRAITRDGIRVLAPTRCIIQDNLFRRIVGGIGINITGGAGAELSAILRNYFYVPVAGAPAAGWAITLGCNGVIISGNRAAQAETAGGAGTNPYRDISTGVANTALNGWSDNFWGPALIATPVIV